MNSRCQSFIRIGLGLAVLSVLGCNNKSSTTAAGASSLAVSPSGFTDGGTFNSSAACPAEGGSNSISYSWSGAPSGTLSYAAIMLDSSFSDFVHMVAFNVPTTVTSTASVTSSNVTYAPNDEGSRSLLGPCPPMGETHTYTITVYALDVADLTTVQSDTSNTTAVIAAIKAHALASGSITGKFTGL